MRKLNICLINDSFPPAIDGVANAVLNYASVLTEDGYTATVAAPQYPGFIDDYSFNVIRFPSVDTMKLVGYRTGYPFSFPVIQALQKTRPDIIHTHCPLTSILLSRLLREVVHAPIVMTYHTKYDIDIKDAISLGFLQQAAKKALVENISACDDVWTVSEGAGGNLCNLGYEGSYTVMQNGVDFPKGKADERIIARLRRQHSLRGDDRVLLFVGRMKWYKGIRIILDGLRMLSVKGYNFKMLFVGDGDDRPEMEAYAAELGLGESVIFTGSTADREELRGYFSLADLFLFPSTFDTNGIVVREAAACGLASLLIRGSCAAEGIRNGDTGILIEEHASSLAAAVEPVLKDPALAHRIGQSAMDKIYISWADAVRAAEERYQLIIEDYKSRPPRSYVHGDDFFRAMGELSDSISKSRRIRSHAKADRELKGE